MSKYINLTYKLGWVEYLDRKLIYISNIFGVLDIYLWLVVYIFQEFLTT